MSILAVSADFPTLADALAGALDGDTITLAAGSYTEDVSLGGRSLTLSGAGSGSTILTATSLGIDATGGGTVTLSGLTVRNGARGIDSTADLTLTDVILTGLGDGTEDGASLRQIGGALTWTGGSLDYGEGANGNVYLESTTAAFDSVDIQYSSAAYGGGVYALDSAVSLVAVGLVRNEATEDGGGLWMSGGTLLFDGGGVVASVAGVHGAGFYALDAEVAIANTTFEQSVAGSYGGAVWQTGGTLAVEGSAFTDNTAWSIADVDTIGMDAVELRNTTFAEWTATEGRCSIGCSVYIQSGEAVLDALGWEDATGDLAAWVQLTSTLEVGDLSVSTSVGDEITVRAYVYGDTTVAGTWILDNGDVAINVTAPATMTLGPLHIEGGDVGLYGAAGTFTDLTSIDTRLTLYGATITNMSMTGGTMRLEGDTSITDLEMDDANMVLASNGSDLAFTDVRIHDVAGVPAIEVERGDIVFDGLSVVDGTGGGLSIAGGTVTFHQAYFGGNSATNGGAIAMESGALEVTAGVFFDNTATDNGGAA